MGTANYSYKLFADCSQFYLQDEETDGALSLDWSQKACDDLLALAPGIIGVGTQSDTFVTVEVEIRDSESTDDPNTWDHIIECSLEAPSGKIVIAGCTESFEEAARICVHPGCYRVRLFYGNLYVSDDSPSCDEHYKIVLWPWRKQGVTVLKRYVDLDVISLQAH